VAVDLGHGTIRATVGDSVKTVIFQPWTAQK
jgi:hypothetical protein